MNFQSIKPIETDKVYLDLAFGRARNKVIKKKFEGSTTDRVKKREAIKLDLVRDVLNTRLKKFFQNSLPLIGYLNFITNLLN